jgi:hypothetical protein
MTTVEGPVEILTYLTFKTITANPATHAAQGLINLRI